MRRGLVALLLLALAGCGSSGGGSGDVQAPADTPTHSASSAASPASTPSATAAPFNGKAYAKKIEKYYAAQLGHPVSKACDTSDLTWQCYYQGMKGGSDKSRLNITLAFDGSIGDSQARDLANQARLGVFNFVGEKFPKLDTIVTYTSDGLDIGTTRRDEVPLLNR